MHKNIIKLFWRTAMLYRFRVWGAMLNSALITVVAGFIGPFIISQLLEQLQGGGLTLDSAWPLLGWYALTQLYGEVIGWRLNLLMTWTFETAAQRDLYQRVFKHLNDQSLSFHANRFGGSIVSQTSKLGGSFERFWDTLIFQIIPVITSIIAATLILWFVFWQYALFLLVVSILFAVLVYTTSRFMAIRNTREAQANTAMNGRLADVVSNITAVKAGAAENKELDSARELATDWRNKSLSTMRGFLAVSTGYASLTAILNMTAIVAAIWASQYNLISLGIVYLAITYTFSVGRQLWEMNNIMRSYNRIMGDAHDMTEILSTTPTVRDTSTKQLSVSSGEIKINNMSYTHDDGEGDTLFRDFDLTIPAGQKVGLVGHSGSGKTTLARLLMRFSNIDRGEILIDGQDIAHVTQASLREQIAYVPQEPLLFHRSLKENILYGKFDASDKELLRAAKQAHALKFIEKLPQGFDTMVGERGVKLSGGQRQRIAIARAILKDAPILVLDEATSALDSESESLIQDALWRLMQGRTAIVIAHRLSTIQKMDRIIVMDNGHIVEDGSHVELIARGGVYASLWTKQTGGMLG